MGADEPMLKNGRTVVSFTLCYDGCSCHNSPEVRRRSKHTAKRADARRASADVEADEGYGDD